MGSQIDVLKLVSSMTLFREVARRLNDHEVFAAADAILQDGKKQGFNECEYTLRAFS